MTIAVFLTVLMPFACGFREHLGQLAQAQGGSYTVTENDVQGIFSSLRRQ